MVAVPRAATVMGLLEQARQARLRGQNIVQQGGSVTVWLTKVRDWFLGNF
jgi:cell division protein FtsA